MNHKELIMQKSSPRRRLLLTTAVTVALTAVTLPADAAVHHHRRIQADSENVVLQWNKEISTALTVNHGNSPHPTPPPVGGRTFAIVHEAIYDAWAAYDHKAVGTQLGGDLRRPAAEHTFNNKRQAISFAAVLALGDLFPQQKATFDAKLTELGYDPSEAANPEPGSPVDVAVKAVAAITKVRHVDGSNQMADPQYKTPEGYYKPANPPQEIAHFDKPKIADPSRWVPLTMPDGTTHNFLTPQFASMTPFLIKAPDSYLPPAPPKYGSEESKRAIAKQMERNANLTEKQKALAEYWQYGATTSSSIPQEWAAFVSQRDHHTLDQDVKMFFALNMGQGDEARLDWQTKVGFDYGRPITMIRYMYAGQQIRGYAGPNQGTKTIDGATWQPYLKTPAFAAYGSGHTGFTAVGAEILKDFTGSDSFGGTGLIKAGSSKIETNMPSKDIPLKWKTFSAAADQVGYSRLYAGVHWEFDHTVASKQGHKLARDVWREAQTYFDGTHTNGS